MKKLKTKYLSFQTQKGGSGKTTLCTIIAGSLTYDKKKVLVIDTDFQNSIVNLIKEDQEPYFEIVAMPKATKNELSDYLETVDGKYDFILIDTPAEIGGGERGYLVEISDLVIVPLVAAELDVHSTMIYLDAISHITRQNNIPVLGVINKFVERRIENTEIVKLEGYTEGGGYLGLKINSTKVHEWVFYMRLQVHKPMINEETKELYTNVLKLIK